MAVNARRRDNRGITHRETLGNRQWCHPVDKLNVEKRIGGNIEFGVSDPKETYGNLVPELAYANTTDFRPYYIYRKVK